MNPVNVSIDSIDVPVTIDGSFHSEEKRLKMNCIADDLKQPNHVSGTIWIRFKQLQINSDEENVWYRRFTFSQSKNHGISVFDGDNSYNAMVPVNFSESAMNAYMQVHNNLENVTRKHGLNPKKYKHGVKYTGRTRVKPNNIEVGDLVTYVVRCINRHEALCPKRYAEFAHMKNLNVNPFFRWNCFNNSPDPVEYRSFFWRGETDVPTKKQPPDTSWLAYFVNELKLNLVWEKDVVDAWSNNHASLDYLRSKRFKKN